MADANQSAINDGPTQDQSLEQANKLFQTGVMLISGKKKSIEKAIKCIQKAITFNDSDYKYWQILGEAYYQRGSLNPSINCFLKSLKLAEVDKRIDDEKRKADCTYSKLRLSDILLSVGQLSEAASSYLDIVNSELSNAAAIVGYSRTELQIAKEDFNNGLVVSGHSHCMKALQYSLKAIKLCPHLCLTWKLASDCCLTQFIYGQRGQFESSISEKLIDDDDQEYIVFNRLTCIDMAAKFLCKALTIDPYQSSGCLWHNLGISLYLKSSLAENEKERDDILKRSMKCLLKALDSDRDNSQLKNSIGVVAFNLNLLNTAQNFFIRSIRSNMSTSEIQFSNLGFMYAQKGDYRLANAAFNRCQAEEPLHARSWLGNAIISEQKNEDNLNHLRHCHILDNSFEAQLMYSTKVTSLPCTLAHKRDLVSALDSMKRAINYLPLSVEACNTLGLLYERSKYGNQARACFERAHRASKTDSRVIFNRLRQHRASDHCPPDKTSGLHADTEFIKRAEELATSSGNKDYILNFIYFLFNNGDFRNVSHMFESSKLLERIPQNDTKARVSAQILLGLTSRAQDKDYKSWLFKNMVDSESIPCSCIESLINLVCLMLLGSTDDDRQLVEQTSGDLLRYIISVLTTRPNHFQSYFDELEGQWIRLAMFSSIFCLGDPGKIIRPILALFPTIAELWLLLGISLIFNKKKYQVAVDCIEKANLMGSNSADLCTTCDILLAILVQAGKQAKPAVNRLDLQSVYLSRAIYKYPDYQLLWNVLRSERKLRPSKGDHLLCDEVNSSLFNLAIEHTIKLITA